MLITAKAVVHGTLCFATEMVAEPFGFKAKLCFEHVISVQNRRMRRPFHNKIEVCGAMTSSRTSQRRDLANLLAFEPLSPGLAETQHPAFLNENTRACAIDRKKQGHVQ